MKKIVFTIIFIALLQNKLVADVIYSPFTNIGAALSLEFIGSYELRFTKFNTINFWGGIGVVSAINKLRYPALGTEAAIELRQYFKSGTFNNFNIGLYTGFAYMRHPGFYHESTQYNNSIGLVPGFKLTYKKRINQWLVGEPYISVSIPWYTDNSENLFEYMSHNEPGLVLTMGLRIGFNKVKQKKEKN